MTTVMSRDDALRVLTAPGADFELVEETVQGVPMRVFRNAPPSLRTVLELTEQFADRDAVVYEDERLTYGELLAVAGGLGARFIERYGLAPGDRVAVAMRNYPEWPLVFWAAIAAGLIVVPLNAWWTAGEMRYALEDAGARLLIADGERIEVVGGSLDGLGLRGVIAVRHRGELPEGGERWEDVRAQLDLDAPLPDVEVGPDDDATILYTSGTTGAPKGAVGTHRNHVTNLMNTALAGALRLAMRGEAPTEDQPVGMTTFPIFHIAGQTGMQFAALSGAKLVLLYRWDPAKALELVARERVSSISAVPKTVRELLESPELERHDVSSLIGLASGGGPVPPDLIGRIDRRFASAVSPGNGYGLTETTSAVVINSGEEYVAKPDSVGRPVVGADVRVVDPESGEDLPAGGVGELWVRGPNVVRGYWNKPEDTAASFTDGWFHTGDLGYVDADGLVYVVDRLKDVVIRGGENVYCAEVEAALFEHPDVEDVAIIGLPDDRLGEQVAAVVKPRPGATPDAGDLREFVAGRLARFKVPGEIVFRDEPLPRTATGKVLKRELREAAIRVARRGLALGTFVVLAATVAAAASKPPAGARYTGRTSQGFPVKLRVTSNAAAVTLGLDTRERCSDGKTYRSHATFQKERPPLKADGSFDFIERDQNVPPVGAMSAPFDQTQHVRGRFAGRRVSGTYFSQVRGHDGLRCTIRVSFRGRRR